MRRMRLVLLAIVAGLGLAAAHASLWAQTNPAAGDIKAKLAEALGKLAAYDFGGDNSPLNAISDLVTASKDQPELRKEIAGRLAGVLASGAPQGAKDYACRQLSLIGTADHVPAIAALLADEKLSHMARYALARIPGSAADDALRQALGKVKGKLLAGVINSLGERRDEKAVGDLAKLLGDADPIVAGAAAAALGKIGPAATETLGQALGTAAPGLRPAVAEAYLLCADQWIGQNKREAAIAIYDRIRAADLPRAVRIAATRGAIVARQAAGAALLVEQAKSAEAWQFALALTLIRELPGAEITKAVTAELGGLPAAKQIAVLAALADRRDATAGPAVLRLAKEGDATVRPAALAALAKLGDASLVPVLLATATTGEGDAARAAAASLASLPGKDVEAALLAAVDQGEAKVRRIVIEVLGQRKVAAATPALLKAAEDADQALRLAAIKSLGDTTAAGDLPALVSILAKAKGGPERAAAEPALATACQRLGDKEVTAEKLVAALPAAGAEAKPALLRVLGQIGGTKALGAVRDAVQDGSEEVRDTAVRVLGDWQEAAAAESLRNLAKATDSKKYKILALRGFIRLIGHAGTPGEKKLAMCQEAWGLSERDDEKRLVLGALGGVPSAESLALVVKQLDTPALKNEASAAAVSIGERIVASQPAHVAAAMKKVQQTTENKDLLQKAKELLERAEKK